jgi:two-component system, sporulation sensor kinase E
LARIDTLDRPSLVALARRLGRERGLQERVFDLLQEGVLVVDAEGVISFANSAAHQMLGVSQGGMVEPDAPTLWRLIPGLRGSLAPVLSSELGLTREFELSYPEPRVVRLYLVPFERGETETGGELPRFAVVLTDVTRDKQDVDQRVESERVASIMLLAAGVAHELGNPLNSLTIHLQIVERKLRRLRGGEAAAAGLVDSLRICQDEVARLDGIIANFLQAIRPREPDFADTRLDTVLAEVLRFQERELSDRGIHVEVATSGELPVVLADRDQVKQVFFNLIKNAAEAMPPQAGRLRITARTDEDHVALTFSDNGSGIQPEDLARMFEPYHTTKPDGHGLGMMVVQRILRAHGGHITVASEPGRGATITVLFPLKERRVRLLAVDPGV